MHAGFNRHEPLDFPLVDIPSFISVVEFTPPMRVGATCRKKAGLRLGNHFITGFFVSLLSA